MTQESAEARGEGCSGGAEIATTTSKTQNIILFPLSPGFQIKRLADFLFVGAAVLSLPKSPHAAHRSSAGGRQTCAHAKRMPYAEVRWEQPLSLEPSTI